MTIDLSQAKPGDVFLTRNGEEAKFIACVEEAEGQCVVMLHDGDLELFWMNGTFQFSRSESGMDIVGRKPQKRVFERWVNIWSDGFIGDHKSRLSADFAANGREDRIACLHICREFTEGEGL